MLFSRIASIIARRLRPVGGGQRRGDQRIEMRGGVVDGRGAPVNKARAMVEIDDGVHAASNGVIGSLTVLCTGRPFDFSHGGRPARNRLDERRMTRT
jgi:hypothetical protein